MEEADGCTLSQSIFIMSGPLGLRDMSLCVSFSAGCTCCGDVVTLSLVQYVLYLEQEKPMDNIQCSSKQQSEDYYKLLANNIDLLAVQSDDSVQPQLLLIT